MAHILLQEEINSTGTPTTPRGSKLDSNWVDVQHVTFTQWVNVQLRKENVQVEDLTSAFVDGVNLCYLLDQLKSKVKKKKKKKQKNVSEIVLSSKMNKKPKIPIQMIENINLALNSMTESGINLTGITSDEINKGNLKICLALVWRMILFYQINSSSDEQSDVMESPNNRGKVSVEKSMLNWVQDVVSEYTEKYGFSVGDISSSWSDGKALGAVIDKLMKEKFRNDLDEMFRYFNYERDVINTTKSKSEINEHLVSVANDQLEIPNLIDSNILEKGPEKLSMLTYLSYFKEKGEELMAPVEEGTPASNPVSPRSPRSPISPRSPRSPRISPRFSMEEPPIILTHAPELSHDEKTCPYCSDLKVKLELKVSECSKLEIDINEKKQQIEAVKQSINEVKEISEQKLALIVEEKQKLVQELEKITEELSTATKHLEKEKEEIEKVRESEQSIKSNLEVVKSELTDSNNSIDELRKEVARLTSVELELKEKLDALTKENTSQADKQLSSLQIELKNLKELQEQTLTSLAKEKAEKQAIQEKYEKLQTETSQSIEKHTESVKTIENELNNSKKILEEITKKHQNEKEQVERLQSSNKELNVQIETLTNQKIQSETKLNEEIEKNQSLLKQNERLTSTNNDSKLQETINQMEQDLKNQRKEKSELESKINNLKEDHEKSLSKLREEKQKVEHKISQFEKDLTNSKQLEQQNSLLTQQLESLQKDLIYHKKLNESQSKSDKDKIQELSNSLTKESQTLKEELLKEKQLSSRSLENEKNLKNQINQFAEQLNSSKVNYEKERKEKESIKQNFDKAIEKIKAYEEKLKSLEEKVELSNSIVAIDDEQSESKEELNPIETITPRNERESVTNMVYYFFAVLGVSFLLELSK